MSHQNYRIHLPSVLGHLSKVWLSCVHALWNVSYIETELVKTLQELFSLPLSEKLHKCFYLQQIIFLEPTLLLPPWIIERAIIHAATDSVTTLRTL